MSFRAISTINVNVSFERKKTNEFMKRKKTNEFILCMCPLCNQEGRLLLIPFVDQNFIPIGFC